MRGRSHWVNVHKWKLFELEQKRGDRKYFQYVGNFCKAKGRNWQSLTVSAAYVIVWLLVQWAHTSDSSKSANREIHPDGLPPSYTIILLFRLLPDTPSEPFDIWQIADKNNNPEVGVTVNRKRLILF